MFLCNLSKEDYLMRSLSDHLKLGQTFTLPHIQNRCWRDLEISGQAEPKQETEKWPKETSTCHMSLLVTIIFNYRQFHQFSDQKFYVMCRYKDINMYQILSSCVKMLIFQKFGNFHPFCLFACKKRAWISKFKEDEAFLNVHMDLKSDIFIFIHTTH